MSVLLPFDCSKVLIKIPFPSEELAKIVYNSLRVDREPIRGGASRQFQLHGHVLIVLFEATLAKNVRVSVTTLLELTLLSMQTIDRFKQ